MSSRNIQLNLIFPTTPFICPEGRIFFLLPWMWQTNSWFRTLKRSPVARRLNFVLCRGGHWWNEKLFNSNSEQKPSVSKQSVSSYKSGIVKWFWVSPSIRKNLEAGRWVATERSVLTAGGSSIMKLSLLPPKSYIGKFSNSFSPPCLGPMTSHDDMTRSLTSWSQMI